MLMLNNYEHHDHHTKCPNRVTFFHSISISVRNKHECGIVPKSYIHILDCELTSKNEYVVKRSAIVDEITTVLCEWGNLFRKFYLTNHEVFQPIRHKILELIGLRSQILSGNLPVDEMKRVKLMATSEIDTGNKLLGKFRFAAELCVIGDCCLFTEKNRNACWCACVTLSHWCEN